jgi:hypothetical protein
LATQRSTEKRSFDPTFVGDDHSPGHRIDERLYGFVENRRVGKVGGANAVDEDRSFRERPGRATDAVDGASNHETTCVDRDRGKRNDFVLARVESAQFEVDDAVVGATPRRFRRRD